MAGETRARPSENIEPIQEDLVRAELERLCLDELFRDTTRMKRFLRYVVEETLDGRGDRLKGYVIGVEVFDRPENFDPQADTIVRVQAGQLRRRLDLYYADRGQSSRVRILVPKGRYAPTFELRQNLVSDESADAKKLVSQLNQNRKDPRPSLAVLTLDDLSLSEGEAHSRFAEGLTAEIVNALVQFRSMRTVTLTPSVSTTLSKKSVREIGEECGADFVLSGSVRRDGEVFRVTVSLISCETNEHLFSRVFDREYKPGSLFNLQEEIASYTAAAIAAPYGAINRYNRRSLDGRQVSMEAYSAVLRYYDIKLSPTQSRAESLLKDVETITETQPKFSTGWAIQALLNNYLATLVLPIKDAEAKLIEADRTARRALSADSENALAYFALFQSYYHRGEYDSADRIIRRSLSLNPNDYSSLSYYAICLALGGELDLASTMSTAAFKLITRAPTWYHIPQMIIDFSKGRYELVSGLLDEDETETPSIFYLICLSAKVHLGYLEEARELIKNILEKHPDYASQVSRALELWRIDPAFAKNVDLGLTQAGLDIATLKSPKNEGR